MTKQYNLVAAKGRWCSAAGKVTVGLASHCHASQTLVVYPSTGSMAKEREMSTPPTLHRGMVRFTLPQQVPEVWLEHLCSAVFSTECVNRLSQRPPWYLGSYITSEDLRRIKNTTLSTVVYASFRTTLKRANITWPYTTICRTPDELFQSVDDKLFKKIVHNPAHVLQPLIPERPPSSYDFRPRTHDKLLLNKTSYLNEREFLIRMLYKDSYWLLTVYS